MKKLVNSTLVIVLILIGTMTSSAQIPDQNTGPDLSLEFVEIPLESSEEDEIVITFSLTNNEVTEFQDLRVVLYKGQSDGPPGNPIAFIELTSIVINSIGSGEMVTDDLIFTEEAGSYTLQLAVTFQNAILQNTAVIDTLEIYTAPVGEISELAIILAIIYGSLIAIVIIRPIIRKVV